MENDSYLDDGVHYKLSVELKVLVTDLKHKEHGKWWWIHEVPRGVEIDKWWEN